MLILATSIGYFSLDVFLYLGLPAKIGNAAAFGAAFSYAKIVNVVEETSISKIVDIVTRKRP